MSMDPAKLLEIQRRVTHEHMAAEDAGDWDRTMKTYANREEATFDAVPMNQVFLGKEQIRGFYDAVSSALPDVRFPIITESHVPSLSILETEPHGTHTGADFAGIKANGKKVKVRLAAFFVFDKNTGEMLCERAYWDMETLLSQMR